MMNMCSSWSVWGEANGSYPCATTHADIHGVSYVHQKLNMARMSKLIRDSSTTQTFPQGLFQSGKGLIVK